MGNLICKILGHKQRSGWWGDGLYGEVRGGYADGVGRTHYTVHLNCDRCGQNYIAARFHGRTKAPPPHIDKGIDNG